MDFLKDKKRIPPEELYVKKDNIKAYRFPDKYAATAQIKSKGDRVFIKALGKKDTVDGVTDSWAYIGKEYKSSKEMWIFKGDLVSKDPLNAEERSRYELKMMQESYRKGLEECRKLPNCEY